MCKFLRTLIVLCFYFSFFKFFFSLHSSVFWKRNITFFVRSSTSSKTLCLRCICVRVCMPFFDGVYIFCFHNFHLSNFEKQIKRNTHKNQRTTTTKTEISLFLLVCINWTRKRKRRRRENEPNKWLSKCVCSKRTQSKIKSKQNAPCVILQFVLLLLFVGGVLLLKIERRIKGVAKKHKNTEK